MVRRKCIPEKQTEFIYTACCMVMKTVMEGQKQLASPIKESQTRRRDRRKFRELDHQNLQADPLMEGMPTIPGNPSCDAKVWDLAKQSVSALWAEEWSERN